MGSSRNRVSVTLSDKEMELVRDASEVLGIKPTRLVYECVRLAVPVLLDGGDKLDLKLRQARLRLAHSQNKDDAIRSMYGLEK